MERGGTGGKTAVVGAKDRETNQVAARAVPKVDRQTLIDFVDSVIDPDTIDQMTSVVAGMVGKRLLYRKLVEGQPANAPLT